MKRSTNLNPDVLISGSMKAKSRGLSGNPIDNHVAQSVARIKGSFSCLFLILYCLMAGVSPLQAQTDQVAKTPAGLVNPFIGTAKGGNVFPGADYPFGMLQWSPDDSSIPGGYAYSGNKITGFSLTHFSGRGHFGWQDFPFMPTLEKIGQSPGLN